MKIKQITLENFGIYKGLNSINFSSNDSSNVAVIAGKNGFGKTTFLTSLIWCFYGRLMSQVEDKYKIDIKNSGGYTQYLNSLVNKDIQENYNSDLLSVEIVLEDLLIPSIPCKTVTVKRSFNIKSQEENLEILIDGDENELTKSVGYEVFINDFILPREIAKFFFFDAEKIVTLAEAKSKSELRSLSKAYSEVLGIKKYEELKKNLESLLTKLKHRGVNEIQKVKLDELISEENVLERKINHNLEKQSDIKAKLTNLKLQSDSLQEKLIREGNSITLDELKELKEKRDELKVEANTIKNDLKKLLDLIPLVLAGRNLEMLNTQLELENNVLYGALNREILEKELKSFSENILKSLDFIKLGSDEKKNVEESVLSVLTNRLKSNSKNEVVGDIYLEFSEEKYREFKAIYDNIKSTFLSQFQDIVKKEKVNRAILNRTLNKIKQAEARKDNHLAKQFRLEKTEADAEIDNLYNEKNDLIEELGTLKHQYATQKKIRVEYEKEFNLIETDKKKYQVTLNLLDKINELILKIKQEKKFSLQKSVLLGLKKLMHKRGFISNVRVNIEDDVMDIDLLDSKDNVIDKNSLSKGEQQLYATALLKALVDESGIKFPIFIDSPLQKFDKFHSKNIIQEFYPNISEQVVLFPLLEKELSEIEYGLLKPNLNKAFLIQNENGASSIKSLPISKLFSEFKKEKDVYTY